jgi:GNAT superfamily N-acetyltransferase
MSPELRKATRADNDRIAATFASAFEDDPTFSWFFPDPASRRRRLHGFFAYCFPHMALPFDETWMTEDGAAVAVWIPPDQWKMPATQQLRMLPGFVRWAGRRTPRVLRTLGTMDKHHPHDPPSWYLLGLATEKERQSKGLGSALVSHMLQRSDAEGIPAYLESSCPRNIPFYARHGFVESDPLPLGEGAPIVTPMWRDAREFMEGDSLR